MSGGIGGAILGLFQSASRAGEMLAAGVDERARRLGDAVRAEVRRAATLLALSILAATCGFAALVFCAIAVMIAAWNSHPALAASLVAAGFVLVAAIAIVIAHGKER